MSLLEDRYRYLLRMLPASYRAEREAEMVSAFLEGAGDLRDEDNPRPRWSEVVSIVGLSVRVRLGGVGAVPRFFAWGEAVRLVAVLALAFHATMSCAWLAETLKRVVIPLSGGYEVTLGAPGSAQRSWEMAYALSCLLWTVAFVFLVRGGLRAAKLSAMLALALSWGSVVQREAAAADVPLILQTLLFGVPVLALWAGFHRDAPRPSRPWWIAAVPVAAGVLLHTILDVLGSASMAPVVASRVWAWVWPWLGESGLACTALLAAGVACAGTHLRAPAGRSPSLPLALAILIVPVTLCRAYELTFDVIDPIGRTMAAVTAGQVVALLVSLLTLGVLAARRMPALTRAT
ncbi:hypothetical protein [Sphaerisporangium fuscum]|uniref:hypothetical protein n=1 Tax=Sphaerisporangium fuscum TaxID=2835868 RepID=UPI001BDC9342|nr:hypothetical protein [Sphaerisporangium fuscum]